MRRSDARESHVTVCLSETLSAKALEVGSGDRLTSGYHSSGC